MIKKFALCMAVGSLLLSSCSSEEIAMTPGNNDGNVTFTATLPAEILSRSTYDDGKTATNLEYAVYDEAGTQIPTLGGTATMDNRATTVTLNLVTGKKYSVVFWAAAEGAPYKFEADKGTMTVTTEGDAQDKTRDAFFACETFTVTGATSKTVTLKRPFAQINIGTNDLDAFTAAGGSLSTSGITVTAPTVLNLINGTVSEPQEHKFAPAALVASEEEGIAFPAGTEYTYLTTTYILTGDSKTTVDVTWTSDNTSNPEVTYSFVPVQRNFRTNIFGALLTNPTNFNVTIDEQFDENSPININVYDGSQNLAQMIANGGTIEICSPVETIDLTTVPNGVILTLNEKVDNIILGNAYDNSVTVNVAKDVPYPSFTFNVPKPGYDYELKNFTLRGDLTSSEPCHGFKMTDFRHLMTNVLIENVVFDDNLYHYGVVNSIVVRNCNFINQTKAGIWLTYEESKGMSESITIENCNVVTADDAESTAHGLYILNCKNIVVKNCTVTNPKYHGIFVRPMENCTISGCTVVNALQDGIKVEARLGLKQLLVNDNKVQAAKNVVRCIDLNSTETLTITGNVIDMTKCNASSTGILLTGTGSPVMKIFDNTKVGVSDNWINNQISQPGVGSDLENPFKN